MKEHEQEIRARVSKIKSDGIYEGCRPAIMSGSAVSHDKIATHDRRGLIPWSKDDPNGIAEPVISLIGDEEKRAVFRKREDTVDVSMLWPKAADSYIRTFKRRVSLHAEPFTAPPCKLPSINIDHICLLSDHTGILKHASFDIPRYADGYCLDDNARALLLMTLIKNSGAVDMKAVHTLESRYLAFVCYAFDDRNNCFRNSMSYCGKWLDEKGSEESHGRTLWALGTVIGRSLDPRRRGPSIDLFRAALPAVLGFTAPRAWAYALLGLDEYLRAFEGAGEAQVIFNRTAERLFELFSRTSTPSRPWFEDRVTDCGARLSQALLVSGNRMNRHDMKADGVRSLHRLLEMRHSPAEDGCFPDGFYARDGIKAEYDQQPVEAGAMVSACLTAQRITRDNQWIKEARRAFDWFLGRNVLRQSLYEPSLGACRDGLHPNRMNENMGADSTLSFLIALTEMRSALPSTRLYCVNAEGPTTETERLNEKKD